LCHLAVDHRPAQRLLRGVIGRFQGRILHEPEVVFGSLPAKSSRQCSCQSVFGGLAPMALKWPDKRKVLPCAEGIVVKTNNRHSRRTFYDRLFCRLGPRQSYSDFPLSWLDPFSAPTVPRIFLPCLVSPSDAQNHSHSRSRLLADGHRRLGRWFHDQ
jgi:hypothetical protein